MWRTLAVLTLERLRQENHSFKPSLGYMRLLLKKKKTVLGSNEITSGEVVAKPPTWHLMEWCAKVG